MTGIAAPKQAGTVLVISLVVLVVMTLVGLSAMRTSLGELRMTGNTEDMISSFHAAEAGISAVLSLIGTDNDPFEFSGSNNDNPLAGVTPDPLAGMSDVTVAINMEYANAPCGRASSASSHDLISCNFLEIVSEHAPSSPTEAKGGARSRQTQGVRKQTISY